MRHIYHSFSKILWSMFIAFAVSPSVMYAQSISRISGSPYPASATPDTLYMVHIDGLPASQQMTLITLQGLLAKVKPQIMVTRSSQGFINDLRDHYGVTYDSTYFSDFKGLLTHFKPRISGYILCNANDSTNSAAISLCSPLNGIAVNPADTALLDSVGISQIYSTCAVGGVWSYDTFQTRYSKKILTLQDWTKSSFLADYSVFAGAYQFYDLPITQHTHRVMSHMDINGAVFGWFAGEQYLVTATSQYGLHVHASDWSSNLSVYSNFSIPQQHQVNHTDDTILRPGVHTVCFLMTDGDNIQWLGGAFINGAGWYGNPHRGEHNIGWAISPALAELGPTQMKYIYDSAATTPNGRDGFIAAPSGMGYSYPDIFAAPDSGAELTARMMQKSDLSILNVIAINYDRASLAPYLNKPYIDAILYFTYGGNYYQLHGFSDCINDKPVISARYNLVQGEFSTYTLAQAIDTMPRYPYSENGYSLVAVNVWSSNVDSVIKCINMLDSNVRVVTPESFVKLFKAGNNCIPKYPAGLADLNAAGVNVHSDPNPCSDHMEISYTLPEPSNVSAILYDQYGRQLKTLFSDEGAAGSHHVDIDTRYLPTGIYYYTLRGDYFSATRKCLVIR